MEDVFGCVFTVGAGLLIGLALGYSVVAFLRWVIC